MSWNSWNSSNCVDDYAEYIDVWDLVGNSQEASEGIATRIQQIQQLYKEVVAIADAYSIDVAFSLESEHNKGHNRGEHIRWNASSQNC